MRALKVLLASLMVLVTFITSCNAQCFVKDLDGVQECTAADGVKHPLMSKWKTENCEECSCHKFGMVCCNLITEPLGYDQQRCDKIFHKENCSYTVVEKENSEKACNVTNWIL